MSYLRLVDVSLDYPLLGSRGKSLKQSLFNLKIGGVISHDRDGKTSIRALSNISVDIEEGDRVALIGHNGAGKTTLLRVLSGAFRPQRGEVQRGGRIST